MTASPRQSGEYRSTGRPLRREYRPASRPFPPIDDPGAPFAHRRISVVFSFIYHVFISSIRLEKTIKLFTRFNKQSATARLVLSGLLEPQRLDRRLISNTSYLLAGSLGDSFEDLDPQAAAGLVLLALTKDSPLSGRLNDRGWALVLELIDDHPQVAAGLSPGATFEIARRRPAGPGMAMPRTA